MKVYGLIGKSGTGKSFQAVNLCKRLKIESIIDDGLFICRNKVVAGVSAKRQPTKVGAVKSALFYKEEHMTEVKEAIQRVKPLSILILGTSDGWWIKSSSGWICRKSMSGSISKILPPKRSGRWQGSSGTKWGSTLSLHRLSS